MIEAVWIPAWYELDQEIIVNQEEEYWFVNTDPIAMRFYQAMFDNEQDVLKIRGKIISIESNLLGSLYKVETRGLSYKFYLSPDVFIQVCAEEHPGLIEENLTKMIVPPDISAIRCLVKIETD